MKNNKLKKTTLVLGVGIILLGTTLVFAAPGSEDDPLVSLSYLEDRIEQLEYSIEEKLDKITDNEKDTESNDLEIVEISAGESIICKDGTEIILRGGKARVIAAELGGLSDITAGEDLKMDEQVPPNHLIIVPRDDERGVHATEDAIFMIRGEYEIR